MAMAISRVYLPLLDEDRSQLLCDASQFGEDIITLQETRLQLHLPVEHL